MEVESGFHLYFNLPGLKIQSYEILRKDGNREWKKTWVQLSLSVQVHWHQSLLHFRMAEREPVPLLRPPSSIASWQPLLSCIYTAASVHLKSTCLQWICQLSPLTLLWFTSQSWFRSEETNCQLKPNKDLFQLVAGIQPETEVNLNQTDGIHLLCTPSAISLHRSAQLPKLLIPATY